VSDQAPIRFAQSPRLRVVTDDIATLEDDAAMKAAATRVILKMIDNRYGDLIESGSGPTPPELIALLTAARVAAEDAQDAQSAVDRAYKDAESRLAPAPQTFASRSEAQEWVDRLDGDEWNAMTRVLRLRQELAALPNPIVEKDAADVTGDDLTVAFKRLEILDEGVEAERALKSIDASLEQALAALEAFGDGGESTPS